MKRSRFALKIHELRVKKHITMWDMSVALKMGVTVYSDMERGKILAPKMEDWRYDKMAEMLLTEGSIEDLSIELEILGFEMYHQNMFKCDGTGKANEIMYMIWYATECGKFTGAIGDKILQLLRKELVDDQGQKRV